MTDRLRGKTALVTAAGQGMGRAGVLAFVREGATVIAADVRGELLTAFDGMAGVTTRVLDVLDDAAVDAAVDAIGAVDVLFNCAGWVHQGSLLDCTIADWDRSFDLNVRSMFVVTKAMLPKMIANGGGTIVNMSSVVGAHKAAPNRLAYAASKAAVVGFTRALALDHVRQGIRCNCVCPGTVDTPSLGDRINDSRLRVGVAVVRSKRGSTSSPVSRWAVSPPPRRSPRPSSSSRPTSRRS